VIQIQDPHENLKYKLRTMSDRDLIEFGKAARERCKDRQNQEAWTELKLAREEWLSRQNPRNHGKSLLMETRLWAHKHRN
jgi:hypothetical protein